LLRGIDREIICCGLESFVGKTHTQEVFKEIYKFPIEAWLSDLTELMLPFETDEEAIEAICKKLPGEWILTYTGSENEILIKVIKLKDEEFE